MMQPKQRPLNEARPRLTCSDGKVYAWMYIAMFAAARAAAGFGWGKRSKIGRGVLMTGVEIGDW